MRAAVSPDISDLSFIVISRMVLNRSIPLWHKDNIRVIPQKRLMPEPEFHLHRQHSAKLIHPLLTQRQHTGNKHPTKNSCQNQSYLRRQHGTKLIHTSVTQRQCTGLNFYKLKAELITHLLATTLTAVMAAPTSRGLQFKSTISAGKASSRRVTLAYLKARQKLVTNSPLDLSQPAWTAKDTILGVCRAG